MAVFVVGLVFILALAGYSDASYCVCNSGLSDSVLQKSIDYACGAGADCAQIQQNGPCFNPNTVKDHCNYAVNSYYQKKGQTTGSCDFSGTATVVPNPPSVGSGCVFPSGSSNAGGGTTPSGGLSPPTGLTPTTPTPPASPTIGGGGATPTPPGTFPGSSTNTPPGSPLTPGFGLGPTGSGGFGSTDSASSVKLLASQSSTFVLVAMLLLSSLFCTMI